MTIRARLLLLVGIGAVAFVALAAHASSVAWRARRDAELTANLEMARTVAGALRTYVHDVVHQSGTLGRALAGGALDAEAQNRLLGDAVGEYASIREFAWLDPEGIVRASSNRSSLGLSLRDRAYVQRVLEGEDWVVSDLVQARVDNHPVVVIARGIRLPGGDLAGITIGVIAPERLGVRALAIAREGDAAVALVDGAGRLVFRTPALQLGWEERLVAPRQAIVAEALAGREAAGSVLAESGDERLGAAVPVPELGWAVRASRSKAETMGPLRREILVVAAAGGLLSLLAMAASTAVGARTVAALRRLERRAGALARGERPAPAGREPEEIARLGAAYERMAGELLATQDRFRAVFEGAPAGIAVFDAADLTVRWANRAYLAFLEEPFRSAGIEGRRLEEFLPNAAGSGLLDVFRRVAAGEGDHEDAEIRFDGFARGPTWWRWTLRLIPGSDGRRELALLATDVTEQVQAREAVEAERRRLEVVLQTLPAGVFIADARGQLVMANDAARRIWGGRAPRGGGAGAEYLQRLRWAETGAPVSTEEWGLQRALRSGEPSRGELLELDRFDGQTSTLLQSAAPVRDASGVVQGAVAALLDVTELRRAVRHRDEMLRVVSHDLRTPLATVTLGAGALARLAEGPGAAAQARRAASRIQSAGRRMARLIEDLLDLASIDEGRLSMRTAECDPADLIGAAAEELSEAARERDLDLCLSVTPGLPAVLADRDRVLQVLGNVASNAVKATEHGAVCLAAERCGDDAIVFRVRDTGPGIPPDDLPHVFDRYHRGAEAGWVGTGLGLAISRALVEAHGGAIWAESVPDQGTTVSFTLPLAASERHAADAACVPARATQHAALAAGGAAALLG